MENKSELCPLEGSTVQMKYRLLFKRNMILLVVGAIFCSLIYGALSWDILKLRFEGVSIWFHTFRNGCDVISWNPTNDFLALDTAWAYWSTPKGRRRDIIIFNSNDFEPEAITENGGNAMPMWSRDGKKLLWFHMDKKRLASIYISDDFLIHPSPMIGKPILGCPPGAQITNALNSPNLNFDGRYMALANPAGKPPRPLFVYSNGEWSKPQSLLKDFDILDCSWRPHSNQLALLMNLKNRKRALCLYDLSAKRIQLISPPNLKCYPMLAWSEDGKSLYFTVWNRKRKKSPYAIYRLNMSSKSFSLKPIWTTDLTPYSTQVLPNNDLSVWAVGDTPNSQSNWLLIRNDGKFIEKPLGDRPIVAPSINLRTGRVAFLTQIKLPFHSKTWMLAIWKLPKSLIASPAQ